MALVFEDELDQDLDGRFVFEPEEPQDASLMELAIGGYLQDQAASNLTSAAALKRHADQLQPPPAAPIKPWEDRTLIPTQTEGMTIEGVLSPYLSRPGEKPRQILAKGMSDFNQATTDPSTWATQRAMDRNVLDPEAVKAISDPVVADLVARAQAYAQRAGELPQSQSLAKMAESGGFLDALSTFADNPVDITLDTLATSAWPMIKVAGPTGVGAAVGGPATAFGAALNSSYKVNFDAKFAEVLAEKGVDLTDEEALGRALSNPEIMAEATDRAARYSTPIALTDALTGGIAGVPLSKGPLRNIIAQGGVQATGGAGGEAAGQIAETGEIHSPHEVLLEGIAEVPGTFPEAGGVLARQIQEMVAKKADSQTPQAPPSQPPVTQEPTVAPEQSTEQPESVAASPLAPAPENRPQEQGDLLFNPETGEILNPDGQPAGLVPVETMPGEDQRQAEGQAIDVEAIPQEEVAHEVSQEAMEADIQAGTSIRRFRVGDDKALDEVTPDRRVAEMNPEEMQQALLTNDLTGLPNRRAFIEAPKRAVRTSMDADSLKWVNDNLGHDAGNEYLRQIADVLRGQQVEGVDVFHISGDEFIIQADNEEIVNQVMESLNQRLTEAPIEIETKSGKIYTVYPGVSHGTGPNLTEAEGRLYEHKESREQAGLRAARGEKPPGVSERGGDTAGGVEGRQDPTQDTPQKVETAAPPEPATKEKPETPALAGVSVSGEVESQPGSGSKIKDFGEKIGGARKDTVIKTGPSATKKKKSDTPAWRRRYELYEVVADSQYPEAKGKFRVWDKKTDKDIRRGREILTYDTEAEAEAAIPLVEVARNHRVQVAQKANKDDPSVYEIVRTVTDRKRPVIKSGFDTREAAMKYLVRNAVEIIETKTRVDDSIHPALDKAIRKGEQRRADDRDVGAQDFEEVFGFRGVEFGNWNNNAERQHILNQAYDALLDLAEMLKIPPRAISLNGELALAFGSRGQGLSGARAHYERTYGVINLTKIKGAGALAHEWLHAFDHYLSRQSGKAKSVKIVNKRGDKVYPTKGPEEYVSHGFYHNAKTRSELIDAFDEVMDKALSREVEFEQDVSGREKIEQKQRAELDKKLDAFREGLSKDYTQERYPRYRGKKNNAPATSEQLAKVDRIIKEIRAGNYGEYVYVEGKGVFSGVHLYDQARKLNDIFKEARGRRGYQKQGNYWGGVIYDIHVAINNQKRAEEFLKNAREKRTATKKVATEYYSEAWKMDQGAKQNYWSSNHEMLARAFESYIYDRLKDIDARNDFLAYEKHNDQPAYRIFQVKPYPEGKEREAINAAFDNLFQVIQTKDSDKGVAMYGRETPLRGAGSTVKLVKAWIADIAVDFGKNAPGVNVVQSESDLPAHLQSQIEMDDAAGTIWGLHDRDQVYLVADNIASKREAISFLAHEAVGHYGIQEMLESQSPGLYQKLLDRVKWLQAKEDKRITALEAEVEASYGDLDEDTLAAEIVAKIAEKRQFGNVFKDLATKVWVAIRKFLKSLGFPTGFSTTEIQALLIDAGKFIQKDIGRRPSMPEVLFHRSLGDIDLDLKHGARALVEENGDLVADLEDLVRGAEIVNRDSETATLKNGDTTFTLVKKGERWVMTDVASEGGRANYGRKETNPNSVEGAKQILKDIDAAVAELPHDNEERLKSKLKDMRPAMLALLTRRHLTDLGQDVLSDLTAYADTAQKMDAARNRYVTEAAEIANEWQSWSSKNKNEADQLASLMHEATIAGVDPSEEYTPLIDRATFKEKQKVIYEQAKGRPGEGYKMVERLEDLKRQWGFEKGRKRSYPDLKKSWEALSPDAKKLYTQIRDFYDGRHTAMRNALLARIDRMEISSKQKRKIQDEIRLQFETQKVQGPYFPLARFGEFWVSAKKPKSKVPDTKFYLFENSYEQQRYVKELQHQGYEVTHGKKLENIQEIHGAGSSFVADVIKTVEKAGGSDSFTEGVQDAIYQLYLTTLPDLSVRKHFIHRKKTEGYSNDAQRAFAKQVFHGSYQLAKLDHADILEGQLENMRKGIAVSSDSNKASDIFNEMEKRHQWMMNPQSAPWSSVATSIGFVWYLGATVAAAIVNTTQTVMVALPVMAAKYGWANTIKALNAAAADYFKGRFSIEKTLSGDELKAYRQYVEDGLIDKTLAHDLAGQSETPSKIYSPTGAKVMGVVSFMFHNAEKFNREVTSIAAYRLARDAGDTHNRAQKEGADLTWESHFDYSNANKARFMQNDFMKVLLMFRQYSLNMTYLLARSAYQSVKGESPEVRRLARRKLAGILGMHALVVGAKGLPLASMVESIMNLIFDDEDEPWDFWTEFRNFLADHIGQTGATAVTKGLGEVVTGADLTSRIGLNELWFRSPDRDLEAKAYVGYWIEQVLGPMGAIFINGGRGIDLVSEGHTRRGIEAMLPKFAKDGLKAIRYNQEGVQTLRGDPIIEDTTGWQETMQAIGFTPGELSMRYDANRATYNYMNQLKDRRQFLMNRWALATRMGDDEMKQETMDKIRRYNGKNPSLRISLDTLKQSMKARMRYGRQTEGGVHIPKSMRPEMRDRVRFANEGDE